jgi:TolB-like protein/DNA-binding winged helix-turn-helix (wHTH) protein/Tfp pilus assembly protein PilF
MLSDSRTAVRAWRFGVFELDLRAGELRRGGVKLRLRGQPIEILRILIERQGELVPREEIRQRLWPADTFVDFDHGLNAAVNRLREAIGDAADNPRFIETVPRRGYRFIAPVQPVPAAPAVPPASPDPVIPTASARGPAPSPPEVHRPDEPAAPDPASRARGDAGALRSRERRWALVSAVLAVALAAALVTLRRVERPSAPAARTGADSKVMIAVLPFENFSRDPDQEYFSDGITEEMITRLGELHPQRIGVIARTTVMQYKRGSKNVADIGRELNVDYVLEGSVRRSSRRVRIVAQLVQVSDQTQVWSQTYERDEADLLAIQSEVATRIANALSGGVLTTVRPALAAPDSDAYELALRGRYFRQQASAESVRRALEYFERAIALAPDYAPAHAGLSDCYRLLAAPGWEVERPAALMTKAREAALRTQQLAPDLPEGFVVRAMVRFNAEWDVRGAERDLLRAIELNPSLSQAHQYYSSLLTTMNRPDEAIASARLARDLDPLSPTANTTLGVRLYYAGRYEEAIAQFRRTLEVTPAFAVAHWGIGESLRELGRLPDAIAALERAVALSGSSTYMPAWLGHAVALANQHDRALAIDRDLEARSAREYVSPFHRALIRLGLGDEERTMDWLEKAYADGSAWMVYLPAEPEFRGLHANRRFQQLLARVRERSSN